MHASWEHILTMNAKVPTITTSSNASCTLVLIYLLLMVPSEYTLICQDWRQKEEYQSTFSLICMDEIKRKHINSHWTDVRTPLPSARIEFAYLCSLSLFSCTITTKNSG